MKERTLIILKTLVQDFIETANPVASKKLIESHNFDISSATVRNEFAILEEVGLIHSPHVSAGKVPTQKGYRFFVDELIDEQEDQQIVHNIFEKYVQEYKLSKSKESLFDALRIISQLSGNVAFASIEDDQTFYLGLSNVLRSPEFIAEPEKAAQIFEVFEGRTQLQKLLSGLSLPEKNVKIFIGEENLLEEISSCAMLVSYFKNENISGHLGILGPMRMKYGVNKALLENTLDMII